MGSEYKKLKIKQRKAKQEPKPEAKPTSEENTGTSAKDAFEKRLAALQTKFDTFDLDLKNNKYGSSIPNSLNGHISSYKTAKLQMQGAQSKGDYTTADKQLGIAADALSAFDRDRLTENAKSKQAYETEKTRSRPRSSRFKLPLTARIMGIPFSTSFLEG